MATQDALGWKGAGQDSPPALGQGVIGICPSPLPAVQVDVQVNPVDAFGTLSKKVIAGAVEKNTI